MNLEICLLPQKHYPSMYCQGIKDDVLMRRGLKWTLREDIILSRKEDSSILPTPRGIVWNQSLDHRQERGNNGVLCKLSFVYS